jgi:hypothetical protein
MKINNALKFTLQLQLCQMNRIEELHQTIRRNIHVVKHNLKVYITLNVQSLIFFFVVFFVSFKRIPVQLLC